MINNLRNLLSALVLTTVCAIPTWSMDEHQDQQNMQQQLAKLWEQVGEEIKDDYVTIRTQALARFENRCCTKSENGAIIVVNSRYKLGSFGLMEDSVGWSTAFSNFRIVMVQENIPAETQWPIRGYAKKYNERLLIEIPGDIREITADIEKQKQELFETLQISLM